MDVSGEHQLDIDHNIFKKRLATDGTALGVEKEVGFLFSQKNAYVTLSRTC